MCVAGSETGPAFTRLSSLKAAAQRRAGSSGGSNVPPPSLDTPDTSMFTTNTINTTATVTASDAVDTAIAPNHSTHEGDAQPQHTSRTNSRGSRGGGGKSTKSTSHTTSTRGGAESGGFLSSGDTRLRLLLDEIDQSHEEAVARVDSNGGSGRNVGANRPSVRSSRSRQKVGYFSFLSRQYVDYFKIMIEDLCRAHTSKIC